MATATTAVTHQPQDGYMHHYLNEFIGINHASLDYAHPFGTDTVISTTIPSVHTADAWSPGTLMLSHYRVGDTVPLTLDYAGFNGDELITLFFSFVKSTGEEKHIMQQEFTTATGGVGRFETSWVIPWDMFYAGEWPQQQSYVVIRASNDMTKTYTTDKFSLAIFTDHDGIFTAPASYEVVTPGETYVVKWNPTLLNAYVPTVWNSPLGITQVTHSPNCPTHAPLQLPHTICVAITMIYRLVLPWRSTCAVRSCCPTAARPQRFSPPSRISKCSQTTVARLCGLTPPGRLWETGTSHYCTHLIALTTGCGWYYSCLIYSISTFRRQTQQNPCLLSVLFTLPFSQVLLDDSSS